MASEEALVSAPWFPNPQMVSLGNMASHRCHCFNAYTTAWGLLPLIPEYCFQTGWMFRGSPRVRWGWVVLGDVLCDITSGSSSWLLLGQAHLTAPLTLPIFRVIMASWYLVSKLCSMTPEDCICLSYRISAFLQRRPPLNFLSWYPSHQHIDDGFGE